MNKIGNNIKILRCIFGETQLELATAIGLDSPNAIANYEKGIRIPQDKYKKKIAEHYRITVEELVNSDISACKFPSEKIFSKENILEMSQMFLPVLCDDKCLKFPMFQMAFNLHLKALRLSDRDLDLVAIKEAITSYLASYHSERLPEALINVLQLLTILNFAYSSNGIEWNDWTSHHNNLTSDEILKRYYLKDCSNEATISPWKSKINIEELNDVELKCLFELKKFPQYMELADYYRAMQYLFGTVQNGKSSEANHVIGDELLKIFIGDGGDFSKQLLDVADNLIGKIEDYSQNVSDNEI